MMGRTLLSLLKYDSQTLHFYCNSKNNKKNKQRCMMFCHLCENMSKKTRIRVVCTYFYLLSYVI